LKHDWGTRLHNKSNKLFSIVAKHANIDLGAMNLDINPSNGNASPRTNPSNGTNANEWCCWLLEWRTYFNFILIFGRHFQINYYLLSRLNKLWCYWQRLMCYAYYDGIFSTERMNMYLDIFEPLSNQLSFEWID